MKHYVFIDESGIHKQIDHSTFVLVYIETANYPLLETKIVELEKQLDIVYFHWAKTVWKVKEQFMTEALKLDFTVKIAVLRNPINPADEYERVLTHLIVEPNIHNIYIDGRKPKWYERKIKKILRDKGVSVKKLKTANSRQFAGLRIADMVAGLSRTYFDGKNLNKIKPYYERLKKKVLIVVQ